MATLDERAIKSGLGRVFCSTVPGLVHNINAALLSKSQVQLEVVAITEDEGTLWAEFAYPVLKKFAPNIENDPVTACIGVTVAILVGKVRVKRKSLEVV